LEGIGMYFDPNAVYLARGDSYVKVEQTNAMVSKNSRHKGLKMQPSKIPTFSSSFHLR
jgi:hypothetical protein